MAIWNAPFHTGGSGQRAQQRRDPPELCALAGNNHSTVCLLFMLHFTQRPFLDVVDPRQLCYLHLTEVQADAEWAHLLKGLLCGFFQLWTSPSSVPSWGSQPLRWPQRPLSPHLRVASSHMLPGFICVTRNIEQVWWCQSLGLDCRGPSLLSWSLSSSLWSLTLEKASIQSGVWAFPMARSWNLCSTASGELRAADSPLKGLGGGFQTPVELWGVCNSCWLATSSKTPSLNHSTKLFPGVWSVITVRL